MATLTIDLRAPDGTTPASASLSVRITTTDGILLDQTAHRILGGLADIPANGTWDAPDLTAGGILPTGAVYRIATSANGTFRGRAWYWDGHADAHLDELPTTAPGVTTPAIEPYDDTELQERVTDLEESGLSVVDATTSVKGVVELATSGETVTGADAVRATTPVGVKAAIDAAVTALLNGAPGALDTLKELADALGDDASFAASVTASLGSKVSSSTYTAGIASEVTRAEAAYVKPINARPVVRLGVFPDSANPTSEAEYAAAAGEPVTVLLDPYNYLQQPNTTKLNGLNARGVMPQVVWMPNGAVEGISNPAYQLADILAGTYDAYMTTFLNTLKGLGYPMQLKWGPEMNGNWQAWSEGVNGNTTGQFVLAWKHVHDLATSLGVTNLEWMWSPTSKYLTSTPMAGLYPGDDYVDSIGVHGYNYGVGGPDGLRTMSQIFDTTFDEIATFARGKPMWIAETGTVDTSGEKAGWIADFFDWIIDRGLAGFIWFNAFDAGIYDWRVNSSTPASNAFAAGMAQLRGIAQPKGKAVAQADGPNDWTGRQNFYAADVVGLPDPELPTPDEIGAMPATVLVNWFTAGMTLELWQANRQLNYDSASPGIFTVPTNASVAFPIGATIDLYQNNTGALTIAGAGGVTVLGLDGSLALAGRYAGARLRQLAANFWVLYGETGALKTAATTTVSGIVELATTAETTTGTDTVRAVTPAGVKAAIDALIAGAPGALDTLNEIAVQLASDESAASALTTTVSGKLAKASNLSDVTSAATARSNLNAAIADSVNTVGTSGSAQTIPDPLTAQTISRVTLSANCTLTFPTAAAGKSLTVILVQDGAGSRTVTWPATVKWPGGASPTLTTTASRRDAFTFVCTDGTNWDGFTSGLNFA